MIKTLMLAGAAASALLASPALARAEAASDASTVDTVVVTGRSLEDTLPEALSKTGVKVDVITSQAIRNGGYVDAALSLQALAPGVFILPKNGPFDYVDISFLGSRTQDVLWMVDGVRINNRLYAGTTPLDTLPAGMIDHIEVLEGGQSLFYGTQAVAGAINVVTQGFTDKPSGLIAGSLDTNGGRDIGGHFSDSLGRSQFAVFGSIDTSNGYRAFRPQDYQPSNTDRNRSYDVYTAGAKYALNLSDQLRLSASYVHTSAKLDYAQPFRVAHDVNSRYEDLATAKIDYQASDRLAFYLKGYYHNWRTWYDTTYNSLVTPGAVDVLYQHAFWGYKDYGLNALGKLDLAKGLEAYFGYDLQRYGGRDEVLVIEQQDEQTQAVFGQLRLTPEMLPGLKLAAGFRYNAPSVGQHATIWNVSGQYDFSDFLYLRGEGGTNFRLPTAEELFANDPLDERGDPNLKPERSTSLNLSLGGRFRLGAMPVHWEVTGFDRRIKDLIDFDTFDDTTQQDVFGNVAGVVRERGGEVQVDAALAEALSASVRYTFNHARQDGGPQLARIPEQLLKASFDFHPAASRIGATVTVNYTGKVNVGISGTPVQYGDYATVDLSGRYFLDDAHHHELSLSLWNLFDKSYGRPSRGCLDVPGDGPYDCSAPYTYVNLGLPRTLRATYSYSF
jgi:outer membrane cobalamin receptor